MTEDIFLVFGLGFFLFAVWLVVTTTRADRDKAHQREDLWYTRELSERREFGYEAVEESLRYKSRHK